MEKLVKGGEFMVQDLEPKDIFIPEEIIILPPQEIQGGPKASVNEIMLKGQHSAIYHRFKLDAF